MGVSNGVGVTLVNAGSATAVNGYADSIPAGTATAATVTGGSFFSFDGFSQASVAAIIAGSNLTAGDIQAQFSNDAGVTISSAWATIVSLTGGAAETKTKVISVATVSGNITAGGSFCQLRLTNGTGTFAGTTIAIQVTLT